MREEQEKMKEEIKLLRRENQRLRDEKKAKEMEEIIHFNRMKQSYEATNLQLRMQCEGYIKKIEELTNSIQILAERTRSYEAIERFFIK